MKTPLPTDNTLESSLGTELNLNRQTTIIYDFGATLTSYISLVPSFKLGQFQAFPLHRVFGMDKHTLLLKFIKYQ